jgi:HK97 family phage prohead protease
MGGSKQFVTTIMSSREASADEPVMTISTAAPDREGDRVLPDGGDLAAYRRNPVVLWAHDRHSLPIGAATGLEVLPQQGLRMKFRWLEGDSFSDRVRNAWSQGIIRAASIGFVPRQYVRNVFGGVDHTEWELLEVSLCPVPANPQAVRALESLRLFSPTAPREEEAHEADDLVVVVNDGPPARHVIRDAWRGVHGSGDDSVATPTRQEVRAALREALRQLAAPFVRDAIMRTTGRVD